MNKLARNLRYDWPLHFILLLTNWLPDNVAFLRLRGTLARPFLGSCGTDLRLGRNITFYNPSNIHIGSRVYIAYGCWFMALDRIQIDDEVIFGPYCIVVTSKHTRINGSFRYGERQHGPIHVNRGCWIASHAVLSAGSTIHEGALISAGAVVNKDIPADTMAGGAPARKIKKLS
jgi:maltose O-acetyltransferase